MMSSYNHYSFHLYRERTLSTQCLDLLELAPCSLAEALILAAIVLWWMWCCLGLLNLSHWALFSWVNLEDTHSTRLMLKCQHQTKRYMDLDRLQTDVKVVQKARNVFAWADPFSSSYIMEILQRRIRNLNNTCVHVTGVPLIMCNKYNAGDLFLTIHYCVAHICLICTNFTCINVEMPAFVLRLSTLIVSFQYLIYPC